jgi:hypothetical protein
MYAEDYAREVVYIDNAWLGNASTPSGGSQGGPCGTTSIQFGDWQINTPSLIPTCIAAALIGIICGLKIKRSNASSSTAYSKSFFMFACMMTDAMIYHCFLHDQRNTIFTMFSAIVDAGLSSSIGLSFGFNALFDMGVMQPGIRSSLIMLGSYAMIIAAWLYTALNGTRNAFVILYDGIIAVSCGLYCVITLIRIIKSKGLGLKWLLYGGFFGFVGLASVYFPSARNFWCIVFTPWFGAEFWWYVLSDLSMYCLYRYYMASHQTNTPSYTKSYASDSEDESGEEESDEEVQILIKPRTRLPAPVLPLQQQRQVVYIPLPYYTTTPTYYAPQVTPYYY